MNTKLTQIARTREIKTKDKNSAGEWVENIFYSKYYETPPYIGVYRRLLHALIDLTISLIIYVIVLFIALVFTGVFLGITNNSDAIDNSSDTDLYLGAIMIFGYFIMPFFYYLFLNYYLGALLDI